MDATFSDDQRLFAETLRDILDGTCPPEAVRASWDDPAGWVDGLWDTLAATGVLGLTAPGSCDGLGLSLIHISEPTRPERISYAVFCLKKKKK